MTTLLGCHLGGGLLPPQIIYEGKTKACEAKFDFPDSWSITHSTSHWSNEETMLQYADNVLLPHYNQQREVYGEDKHGIAIFDVFAAHRTETFKKKLTDNNVHPVHVPAGCTGDFQPLDLTGNDRFKRSLKSEFVTWYSQEIADAIFRGVEPEMIDVKLQMSVLKPLHAKWVLRAVEDLEKQTSIIRSGFDQAGITSAVISARVARAEAEAEAEAQAEAQAQAEVEEDVS